ncbi:MAG: chorismate-binding protein [Bacteroidetes bacterium]|nr:chorismate-binding protein [Bacteroidota bacterium]MDA1120295.1 chorismate-binding protein [Bacteroidota bacterium]
MGGELSNTEYSLASHNLGDALGNIFRTAIRLNFPVAMWQLPLTDEIKLIVDLSGKSRKVKPVIEELSEGFIIAPFYSNDEKSSEFLSADLEFSNKDHQLKVNPVFKDSWTTELFFQGLGFNEKKGQDFKPYHLPDKRKHTAEFKKEDYLDLVRKGMDEILKGTFKKVVLSKTKHIQLLDSFNPVSTFLKLTASYPSAFINLCSLPGKGTWLGATPELLVSQDTNGLFKTVSLAGTQIAVEGSNPLEIGWTQKEIEEQAMVGRSIIDCFKKIRLREFEEDGPKTSKAANLYHLKSEYTVDTKAVNFPQLASVMLELLHPTAAVCGMPFESSMEFILKKENYDREFYSGFLGPVNLNGESQIFVNLRCMQLLQQKAILYAGGGVTENSDPVKEWQETELKCNTLLDIIN